MIPPASSDAVFVALSTETELGHAEMAQYKADSGFDAVRFGVMSPEMLAAVVEAFGHDAANPPATPTSWCPPPARSASCGPEPRIPDPSCCP